MIRMCTKTTKKITNLGCHLLFFAWIYKWARRGAITITGDISWQIISLSALSLSLSLSSFFLRYSHEEKHGKLLKEAPGSKCIQHDRTLLLHANEDIYKDVHSILPGMTWFLCLSQFLCLNTICVH